MSCLHPSFGSRLFTPSASAAPVQPLAGTPIHLPPSTSAFSGLNSSLQSDLRAFLSTFTPYPHPGEILTEEFLRPLGLSQYRLAKEVGVPPRRINEIALGKRAITTDTDLRLCKFFGLSESFWSGLQTDYDREMLKPKMAQVIAAIRPWPL